MSTDTESDRPVFADGRQTRIAELVAIRGSVRNIDLVDLLGVSEPTIRKDMTILEKRGLLKRTHGGAITVRPMVEDELAIRTQANAEAKEAIAQACLQEIREGEAIFLDNGTTIQRVASKLVGRHVTVLTNAIGVAEAVADLPTVEHILIGGQFRRIGGCCVGTLALEALERFTVNVAFLSASGFSESGVTVANVEEAKVKAAMIERARRVILAIDQTKVGATHFARVCGLDAVDVLIIDEASTFVQELCQANGIRLVVADKVG
jgi:DeoR/GlpR family transcriptional regulator of sugar metabolism